MTNIEAYVIAAEKRAKMTNLQRTCEEAARQILGVLNQEGADTLMDVNECAGIIYKVLRERHEL